MGKTVMISGYFDPIHGGHLSHIQAAKKLGDALIVIAGTESQCDKKHGWHFYSWQEKSDLLIALGADMVVPNIDDDGTCAQTILKWNPDIFAKGAEYTPANIPQAELDACKSIGCRIIYGIGKRLNRSSRYYEHTTLSN